MKRRPAEATTPAIDSPGNDDYLNVRFWRQQTAALLFADVAGYSRMMRADEEQTLVDLRAHLAELIAPVVGRYHGRIVKTVGDGVRDGGPELRRDGGGV